MIPEARDIVDAIKTGNWRLHVFPAGGEYYLALMDEGLCKDPLQIALLREAHDKVRGGKAVFFDLERDSLTLTKEMRWRWKYK